MLSICPHLLSSQAYFLFNYNGISKFDINAHCILLQVAATADLMLAYIDFFLGGDEKRADLPPRLNQRLPMSLCFGGDGSYMSPFSLHNDNIVTSLMSQVNDFINLQGCPFVNYMVFLNDENCFVCIFQSVPPTVWYRLVAGLNAQLRLVHCGHLKTTFGHLISWLDTHANPSLCQYGIRVVLAWFQPTTSGYCQFGVVVYATENRSLAHVFEVQDRSLLHEQQSR